MPTLSTAFDLTLAYPQWQGSGRHHNLARGGAATAAVCAEFAPLLQVPLSDANAEAEPGALGVRHWNAILKQFRSAQQLLASSGARRVLTAGGDCAVDIAVIDYLHRVHPGLNVIWIDAHLDANTPQTSPSGSFHGMPVAAILGRAPPAMRPFLAAPISPAQFRYFGTRVGDEGEWALQRELKLQTFEQAPLPPGPVHIHFDLDVLDPGEFPYLAYTDGNLAVADALRLVEHIARNAELVGFTVTEFSPADEREVEEGKRVIRGLCEAAAGS